MDTSNLVLMRMPLGPLGTNCYVIGDKEQEESVHHRSCYDRGVRCFKKHNLKPKAVLLTHGHGDHIGGVQGIVDAYDVPIYIHHDDVKYLSDPELNLSNYSNPTPITVKGAL